MDHSQVYQYSYHARRKPTPAISVIVPALNEEENLPYVLPVIPQEIDEVILVDGHSTDNTVEVAKKLRPGIRIVQQIGKGKGAALRTGFEAARGDIIVMLDADGSTDPREIPVFVGALLAGADFVKGSRFMQGAGTADMPVHRRLGNWGFVMMTRVLFGGKYSDLLYGYNAFWSYVLPYLELDGDGFEIETMMNVRALKAGLKVAEVPSFEAPRVHGIGRLQTFPDGWRVLKTMFREVNRKQRVRSENILTLPAPRYQPVAAIGASNGDSDIITPDELLEVARSR
jgi:glycosyltransferase involved in cell wall biosynthesis